MNKKVNTALFILGATVFNVVTIIIIWIGLQLLIRLIFKEQGLAMGVLVAFLLAIIGNFFLYRLVIKWLEKKFKLGEYLEPLFSRKNR